MFGRIGSGGKKGNDKNSKGGDKGNSSNNDKPMKWAVNGCDGKTTTGGSLMDLTIYSYPSNTTSRGGEGGKGGQNTSSTKYGDNDYLIDLYKKGLLDEHISKIDQNNVNSQVNKAPIQTIQKYWKVTPHIGLEGNYGMDSKGNCIIAEKFSDILKQDST